MSISIENIYMWKLDIQRCHIATSVNCLDSVLNPGSAFNSTHQDDWTIQ